MAERLLTDIGGFDEGEVPQQERPQLFWEKQLMAMVNLLRSQSINLDELRRTVEAMSPEDYQRLGFYPRRTEAVIALLLEKKLITAEEINKRTEEVLARGNRDHVLTI
jgi:hypothetical protein